jgi:hypothetical protein
MGLPLAPFRTDKLPVTGSQFAWQELTRKPDLATTTDGGTLAKSAESDDWAATSSAKDVGKLLADKQMLTVSARSCALRFLDKPQRNITDSPALLWTTKPDGSARSIDAARGVTAEVLIQPSVVADPLRGFDLEVGLKQSDGTMRRYLISILPMRLHAFMRNELHIVRDDLDNARVRAAYRLAIRPDGVAQLYMGQERIGLLEGTFIEGKDVPQQSYVRVGKSFEDGEYTVTLLHAAFDTGGAFAP